MDATLKKYLDGVMDITQKELRVFGEVIPKVLLIFEDAIIPVIMPNMPEDKWDFLHDAGRKAAANTQELPEVFFFITEAWMKTMHPDHPDASDYQSRKKLVRDAQDKKEAVVVLYVACNGSSGMGCYPVLRDKKRRPMGVGKGEMIDRDDSAVSCEDGLLTPFVAGYVSLFGTREQTMSTFAHEHRN